jgi:hypothetical protein
MGADINIMLNGKCVADMGRTHKYLYDVTRGPRKQASRLDVIVHSKLKIFLVSFTNNKDDDEKMILLDDLAETLDKVGRTRALVELTDEFSDLYIELSV